MRLNLRKGQARLVPLRRLLAGIGGGLYALMRTPGFNKVRELFFQELPKHELQDAVIVVVIHFVRRIDARYHGK